MMPHNMNTSMERDRGADTTCVHPSGLVMCGVCKSIITDRKTWEQFKDEAIRQWKTLKCPKCDNFLFIPSKTYSRLRLGEHEPLDIEFLLKEGKKISKIKANAEKGYNGT